MVGVGLGSHMASWYSCYRAYRLTITVFHDAYLFIELFCVAFTVLFMMPMSKMRKKIDGHNHFSDTMLD